MPELPEVETIRRQLEPRLAGCEIVDAGSHPSAKFAQAHEAIGCEITDLRRRGKYLLAGLAGPAEDHRGPADDHLGSGGRPDPTRRRIHDDETCPDDQGGPECLGGADYPPDPGSRLELIVHLGMTGRLAADRYTQEADPAAAYLRAWWRLDDGRTLTFHDVRRFGRVCVVAEGDYAAIPTLHRLGPEPFDPGFTGRGLAAFVRRSDRALKTILLGQRAVAGVGNIYADEALWAAAINPTARRLSPQRADRLVDALREALQSGLDHGGTTLRDYYDSEGRAGTNRMRLRCYGRSGEECLRCGRELARRVIDGRAGTWCPTCQAR